nr:fra a 1-associated protein [Nicotiana tomentosiformis]
MRISSLVFCFVFCNMWAFEWIVRVGDNFLLFIRPSEMVESNKEYTEEDVTDQMTNGSYSIESSVPFDFPGLRSDIENIERSFFGGLDRFFEAAEEMKNGFFGAFNIPRVFDDDLSSPRERRGIPIESHPPKEGSPKSNKSDGEVDLSGLARDV